jgi:hypothetical protein
MQKDKGNVTTLILDLEKYSWRLQLACRPTLKDVV